jgi:hypothetical protein
VRSDARKRREARPGYDRDFLVPDRTPGDGYSFRMFSSDIEMLKSMGYSIVKLRECSGPIEYDGSLEPAYFVEERL